MNHTVICFDYGEKFTGIAIGHTLTKTANPLGVIIFSYKNKIFQELKKIFFDWKPNVIVVGLPLNMDGNYLNITKKCKKFANKLKNYFKIPLEFQDERLTTYEAINMYKYKNNKHDIYKKNKIIKSKNIVDALSASIILFDWLNQK